MHKLIFSKALFFIPVVALAHPGHGALEIHWHLDDLAWVALGALALGVVVLLVRKALKR